MLRNTIHRVNSFFWLLNQPLLFRKSNIGIIQKKFSICLLCSSYLFCESLWKYFWKWTCYCSMNWFLEKVHTHQTRWRIISTIPSQNFWIIWHWNLKKVLRRYHAANFSCSNLQLSLKTMQHSSNTLQSAVIFSKQVLTFKFLSKIWHWYFFNLEKFLYNFKKNIFPEYLRVFTSVMMSTAMDFQKILTIKEK